MVDGIPSELAGPVSFEVVPLHNATLATDDRDALVAFQLEADALMAQVRTAGDQLDEVEERLADVREAVKRSGDVPVSVLEEARSVQARVDDLRRQLEGDDSVARRQFETPPSIGDRVGRVMWSSFGSTAAPSAQQRTQLRLAEEALLAIMPEIAAVMDRVAELESRLEGLGAPYIRGR